MTESATNGASTGGQAQEPAQPTATGAQSGQRPANPYGPYPYPPYPPYGAQAYPYPYPYYAYPYAPQPQTSGWAIASLVCGIAGFAGAGFIGSALAIIFGYVARNEIKRSGDVIQGGAFATAGLVTGYIGLGLAVIGIIVYIGFFLLFIATLPTTGSGGFIR